MKKATKTTKPKALTPAKTPAKATVKTTAKVVAKTTKPVKKAKPATPVKKAAPRLVLTHIHASVDVGFGNSLFLRGEGPGLSWDKGVLMNCVADNKWSISVGESSSPLVFKFLLNDETWCAGDDFTLAPGGEAVFKPLF